MLRMLTFKRAYKRTTAYKHSHIKRATAAAAAYTPPTKVLQSHDTIRRRHTHHTYNTHTAHTHKKRSPIQIMIDRCVTCIYRENAYYYFVFLLLVFRRMRRARKRTRALLNRRAHKREATAELYSSVVPCGLHTLC